MSNYTKATNFLAKDTLPVGDANKKVKGSELDTEFNAISNAVTTKADKNGPTFTGVPSAPTATAGTSTTQIATTAFVNTSYAPKASPALTGTPTAPTASVGTDTTQLATTAFVQDAVEKAGHVDTTQIADDAVTTAKINPTGVTAGTYGSSSAIPAITVNAEGQVTSATTASVTSRTPVITSETSIWSSSSGYPSSFTKYSFAKSLTNNLDVGYFHIEAWSATAPTGGGTTYVQVSNQSDGTPYVEARADQSGSLGRDDATNTTKSEFYVFINLTEDPSNSNNWAVWIKASGGGTSNYGSVALAGYM